MSQVGRPDRRLWIVLFLIAICTCSSVYANPGDQSEAPLPHQTLKGKLDLCVYLVWMWLLISILIFVLVQKIREADRAYHMERMDADSSSETPHATSHHNQ